MKNLLFCLALASFALTGCATTADKPEPIAQGKWIAINPYGYVPPDTAVYIRKDNAAGVVDTKPSIDAAPIVLQGGQQ